MHLVLDSHWLALCLKENATAFSLMTVTVASATFSITGAQSSRGDDVMRLSTALLRISMPEKTGDVF